MTLHTQISLSPVLMSVADGADAPEWVHLLPTLQGAIDTDDNRGPYHVGDAEAIIAASFATSDRLPIDQDHATDLAAPKGLPAPARGWIVEMQAREDGIWGRVEWTGEGRAMVADRAYRGVSPVLLHDKAKRIAAILRASLVNRPNLKGLTALNSTQVEEEHPMDMSKIAEALGLKADASADDIVAAIAKMKDKPADTALQAATDAVAALQATVSAQAAQLEAIETAAKRKASEAFVDRAIAEKVAIPVGAREHYITLHMADPETTEKAIGGMLKLSPTGMTSVPPAAKDGEVSLNASDLEAARVLGIDPAKFAETRKKEAV